MAERVVGLLIETSTAHGRGMLRGIHRYLAGAGTWSPHVVDRGLEGYFLQREADDEVRAWLHSRPLDGLIGRLETAASMAAAAALGIPVVSLSHGEAPAPFPVIETDHAAIARLALDHLRDRGLTSFAFLGRVGPSWSELRGRAFQDLLAADGQKLHRLDRPVESGMASWTEDLAAVSAWLPTLVPPVGLFACNDVLAALAVEACRRLDLAVPDDVAVLGVDDDDLQCELAPVALSSVAIDSLRTGYEAAALLDRLAKGENPPTPVPAIPPLGVVTRRSTDLFVSVDPHVSQAVRLIREGACRGLTITNVLDRVPMSRRVLETRFSSQVGRTLHEEIQRVRLERVKQLLRTTDLSLAEIGEQTGFSHVEHLSRIFKQKIGRSPKDYRQEQRARRG